MFRWCPLRASIRDSHYQNLFRRDVEKCDPEDYLSSVDSKMFDGVAKKQQQKNMVEARSRDRQG